MKQRDMMRIAAAKAQGWKGPWRFGNEHLHGTPPGKTLKTRGHEGEHVPEVVDKIIEGLCRKIKELAFGIVEVRALMDKSEGVFGGDLNDDGVPWSELEDFGSKLECLMAFNWAERIANDVIKYRPTKKRKV